MDALTGVAPATTGTPNALSYHHPGSSSSTSSSSSSSGYGSGHSSASTPVTPISSQYDLSTSSAASNNSASTSHIAATVATVSPYYSEVTAFSQRQSYFPTYASYGATTTPQQYGHVYDAYNASLGESGNTYHNLASRSSLEQQQLHKSSGSSSKHHSSSHHTEKSSKSSEIKNANALSSSHNVASTKPQATATPFFAQPLLHTSSSMNATPAYLDAYKLQSANKLSDYANYGSHLQHAYQQQQQHYYAAKSQLHEGTTYGTGLIKPLSTSSIRQQPSSNSSYHSTTTPQTAHHNGYNTASSAYYDKYMYPPTAAAAAAFYAAPQTQQHVVPAPTHSSTIPPSGHAYHYDAGSATTVPYRKTATAASAWPWNGLDYRSHLGAPAVANSSSYLASSATNVRDPFAIDKYAAKYDKYSAYYPHPTHAQQYMSTAAAAAATHNLWSSTTSNPPHLAPSLSERLSHSSHPYASAAGASAVAAAAAARQNCYNSGAYQQSSCHFTRGSTNSNSTAYMPHPSQHQSQSQYTVQQQHQLAQQQTKYAGFSSSASASSYGSSLKSSNDLLVTSPFDSPPPYSNYPAGVNSTSSAAPTICNDLNFDGCYSNTLQTVPPPSHMQHLSYGGPMMSQGVTGSNSSTANSANVLDYRKSASSDYYQRMVRSSLHDLEQHVANTGSYSMYEITAADSSLQQQSRIEPNQQSPFSSVNLSDCVDKTSPTSTNKNISLRDFLASWNEEEEEDFNNSSMELHYSDGQVAIVPANESSALIHSEAAKSSEVPTIKPLIIPSEEPVQTGLTFNIQANNIQPMPHQQQQHQKPHLQSFSQPHPQQLQQQQQEHQQQLQQQQQHHQQSVPKLHVGIAVENANDVEAGQFINLPDIVIDIEKGSGGSSTPVGTQQTVSTGAIAKTQAQPTANAVTEVTKHGSKDIFGNLDVEKELDELHIKRARKCLEKQLNNEIQILSPEKPNDIEGTVNNFSGKVRKGSSQSHGVIKDSTYINPEHLLKEFEYNDNTSSHSSTSSTFEKEYETFINKDLKNALQQFPSTPTPRKSASKTKCNASINDFVCNEDCCANIERQHDGNRVPQLTSAMNNSSVDDGNACNDECCAQFQNNSANIGYQQNAGHFGLTNMTEQVSVISSAELRNQEANVSRPMQDASVSVTCSNTTTICNEQNGGVIKSTSTTEQFSTSQTPCLQAENFPLSEMNGMASSAADDQLKSAAADLKTDFMIKTTSFGAEAQNSSNVTNEFSHSLDDDSGSNTHSSSNTSCGLKTPTELEQEQENDQNLQDFTMFYKKKRKLVQESKERAALGQPPEKFSKINDETISTPMLSPVLLPTLSPASPPMLTSAFIPSNDSNETLTTPTDKKSIFGNCDFQRKEWVEVMKSLQIKAATRRAERERRKGKPVSLFYKKIHSLRLSQKAKKVGSGTTKVPKRKSFKNIQHSKTEFNNPLSLKNLTLSVMNKTTLKSVIPSEASKVSVETSKIFEKDQTPQGFKNTSVIKELSEILNNENNCRSLYTEVGHDEKSSSSIREKEQSRANTTLDNSTSLDFVDSPINYANIVGTPSQPATVSDARTPLSNSNSDSTEGSKYFQGFREEEQTQKQEETTILEDSHVSSKDSTGEFKGFERSSNNPISDEVVLENTSSSYKTMSVDSSSSCEANETDISQEIKPTEEKAIKPLTPDTADTAKEYFRELDQPNADEMETAESKHNFELKCLTLEHEGTLNSHNEQMVYSNDSAHRENHSTEDDLELPLTPGKGHDEIISNIASEKVTMEDDNTRLSSYSDSSNSSNSSSDSSSSASTTSSSNSSSTSIRRTPVELDCKESDLKLQSPTRRMSDASEGSDFNELKALEKELSQHKSIGNNDDEEVIESNCETMEINLEPAKKTENITTQDIAALKKILESGSNDAIEEKATMSENVENTYKIPPETSIMEPIEIDSDSESEVNDGSEIEEETENKKSNDNVNNETLDEVTLIESSSESESDDDDDDDKSEEFNHKAHSRPLTPHSSQSSNHKGDDHNSCVESKENFIDKTDNHITEVDALNLTTTTDTIILLSDDSESDSEGSQTEDDDEKEEKQREGKSVNEEELPLQCENTTNESSSSAMKSLTETSTSAIFKPNRRFNDNQNILINTKNNNNNNVLSLKSIVETFISKNNVRNNNKKNQNSYYNHARNSNESEIEIKQQQKQKQQENEELIKHSDNMEEQLQQVDNCNEIVENKNLFVIPKLSDLCKIALNQNSSFKLNNNNNNKNHDKNNENNKNSENEVEVISKTKSEEVKKSPNDDNSSDSGNSSTTLKNLDVDNHNIACCSSDIELENNSVKKDKIVEDNVTITIANDNNNTNKDDTNNNNNNDDNNIVERELTVEEALAEMYRQVGVLSDDDENMTSQYDVAVADDGDGGQDVLLINLAEILADNNIDSNDNNIYVLQCDINENILSMVAAANVNENGNNNDNSENINNNNDDNNNQHSNNNENNDNIDDLVQNNENQINAGNNNNNNNNNNNSNSNNSRSSSSSSNSSSTNNNNNNSNVNNCRSNRNKNQNEENQNAIILGNFVVQSSNNNNQKCKINNINSQGNNDDNGDVKLNDDNMNIDNDNNKNHNGSDVDDESHVANVNTLRLIQILNANEIEFTTDLDLMEEINRRSRSEEEEMNYDVNINRDNDKESHDYNADDDDVIESKLRQIHMGLDGEGNDFINLNVNDDLPIIHHEEIVPDNYKKYQREQFLKYLHSKYVQKNLTRFYHANRILKKYRRFLIRQAFSEMDSDDSDTDSDSDSESDSGNDNDNDEDNNKRNRNVKSNDKKIQKDKSIDKTTDKSIGIDSSSDSDSDGSSSSSDESEDDDDCEKDVKTDIVNHEETKMTNGHLNVKINEDNNEKYDEGSDNDSETSTSDDEQQDQQKQITSEKSQKQFCKKSDNKTNVEAEKN